MTSYVSLPVPSILGMLMRRRGGGSGEGVSGFPPEMVGTQANILQLKLVSMKLSLFGWFGEYVIMQLS